jgi:hypothetical protein
MRNSGLKINSAGEFYRFRKSGVKFCKSLVRNIKNRTLAFSDNVKRVGRGD